MSVLRKYILRHDEDHIKELDKRGLLTINDGFCRSCGEVFSNNELVHSKYRSNSTRGQSTVKRHLVCAIFHNITTIEEANKELFLSNTACLIPELVEYQEEKLAEKRRKFFSLKAGATALVWFFMIIGILPYIKP